MYLEQVAKTMCYKLYVQSNTDEDGKFNGVSQPVFNDIMKMGSGRQQKTLAGLDNVSHRYGHENFEKMVLTTRKLLDFAEGQGADVSSFQGPSGLESSIKAFQAFAKHEIFSHLQPNSSVAAHCLCRLLGGHAHDYCDTCEQCQADARRRPGRAPAQGDAQKCKACNERLFFSSDCPPECNGHQDHCDMCDQQFLIFENMRALLKMMEPQVLLLVWPHTLLLAPC